MKQSNIFRTLKDYEAGFYRTATSPEAINAYRVKSEELKAKILQDITKAPEIISEAQKEAEINLIRRRISKTYSKSDINGEIAAAEAKAIELILFALIDSKPL